MIHPFNPGLCDYRNCPSYGGSEMGEMVCCRKAHAVISNKACPKKQATLGAW